MAGFRMARAIARPPRVPEKVVQSHIVQLLRSIGGRAYVLGTRRRQGDYQGTMQTPGLPDVLGFLPPRREVLPHAWRQLWVECKADGGRLRPEQIEFRDLCVAAGVAHIVGDLDVVIAWLVAEQYVTADAFPHYRQPRGITQ